MATSTVVVAIVVAASIGIFAWAVFGGRKDD